MTAKEYLMQVFHIDRRIDSKLEQIMQLREEAMKANIIMTDMPRSGTAHHKKMEEAIVRMVDLEAEVTCEIDHLVDLKAAARIAINALADPEQQLVLELRYLCRKTWEDIAETLNYGLSNIYRIHGLALEKLDFSKDRSKIN